MGLSVLQTLMSLDEFSSPEQAVSGGEGLRWPPKAGAEAAWPPVPVLARELGAELGLEDKLLELSKSGNVWGDSTEVAAAAATAGGGKDLEMVQLSAYDVW